MLLATQNRTDGSRLIHAVAAHFIFEVIHPFYGGNGRTGRFLLGTAVSNILTPVTALSLSRVLHSHKSLYYRAFADAEEPRNHGDLTPFVATMLGFINTAQSELTDDLEERHLILEGLNQHVDTVSRNRPAGWNDRHVTIMSILAQARLFGGGQPVGLTKSQVRRVTKQLEEQELVIARSLKPLEFELTPSGLALMGLDSDLT